MPNEMPNETPNEAQRERLVVVSLIDYHYRVLMVASAVYGGVGLITGGSTQSAVAQQLGPAFQYLWFGTLFICGSAVLATLTFGKGLQSVLLERVALTPLSGMIFTNGVASIAVNNFKTFHWAVLGIGLVVVLVLIYYVRILPAILVAIATLILMGAQGTVIFFGFGVANLYRIFDINKLVKEASSSKIAIDESRGKIAIKEDKL